MVDVGAKPATERVAVAEGAVAMARATLALIRTGNAKKGDVIGAARLAGIMAAKRTGELIPLAHPLSLSSVTIDIKLDAKLPGLRVRATAKTTGQTGVEMEALVAVSVACLTIYDMAKAVDRGMEIRAVRLHGEERGQIRAVEAAGRRLMAGLLPVADAIQRIVAGVAPVETETVALGDALGRTLAAPPRRQAHAAALRRIVDGRLRRSRRRHARAATRA